MASNCRKRSRSVLQSYWRKRWLAIVQYLKMVGDDGKKLKRHLEIEFVEKKNHQIYWDDVAMFCYPQEYQLGVRQMHYGDIIEIDTLSELAQIDPEYSCYLGGI